MIAELVRRFYAELWEAGDEVAAPLILHPDLTFRGSLGQTKTGISGYLDYLRMVRGALGDYRCDILQLITEGPLAAARMRFHGTHIAPFMGVAASDKHIVWEGAAFFTLKENRLGDIWVLGDTDALRRQLEETT